ncbi:MAG: DUF1294 domain-containing protein [Clostridia bacterium]|nr:DUF1294 domain-containing protein [Clostridia bacterium]
MDIELYIAVFAVLISVVSVMLTVYDKVASMSKKWRIPENILMLFAFFGGATAMYCVMQLIRHKTKHKKFMLWLPVFILLHLAIIVYVVYFL